MSEELFEKACNEIIGGVRGERGIGTLGERTLHAVLKKYIEPDEEKTEIKVETYIADIFNSDGITEIQTRSFEKLRKKLEAFLPLSRVTLVYPVAVQKWITWLDISTGEACSRHKSPKRGQVFEIFRELYKIIPFLENERLSLRIVLLDIEEYRRLDGWGNGGKKGSSRFERIPVKLVGEVRIASAEDYKKLIPGSLPEKFTAKEFAAAARISGRAAGYAPSILTRMGVLRRAGKIKNAFLYERA